MDDRVCPRRICAGRLADLLLQLAEVLVESSDLLPAPELGAHSVLEELGR